MTAKVVVSPGLIVSMFEALPARPPLSTVRVGELSRTIESCSRRASRLVEVVDDRRDRANDMVPALPMVTSRVTVLPGAMFVAETTSSALRLFVIAIDAPVSVVVVVPPLVVVVRRLVVVVAGMVVVVVVDVVVLGTAVVVVVLLVVVEPWRAWVVVVSFVVGGGW